MSDARSGSLPVSAAVAQRSMWLDCVELWIVSCRVSAIDLDHRTARLHRLVRLTLARQPLRDDPVGGGEHRVDIAITVAVVVHHVAAGLVPQQWSPGLERFGDGGDRVERRVVDLDEFERVLGEVARGGDHERHGIADVPDPLGAERVEHRRVQARPTSSAAGTRA